MGVQVKGLRTDEKVLLLLDNVEECSRVVHVLERTLKLPEEDRNKPENTFQEQNLGESFETPEKVDRREVEIVKDE